MSSPTLAVLLFALSPILVAVVIAIVLYRRPFLAFVDTLCPAFSLHAVSPSTSLSFLASFCSTSVSSVFSRLSALPQRVSSAFSSVPGSLHSAFTSTVSFVSAPPLVAIRSRRDYEEYPDYPPHLVLVIGSREIGRRHDVRQPQFANGDGAYFYLPQCRMWMPVTINSFDRRTQTYVGTSRDGRQWQGPASWFV